MFFSLILPVYNIDKEELKTCIDSVANQTFKDFEVILVDDGSKEETARLCDQIASQYNFMSVIHQENKGLAGARNTGVTAAKGEYLVHIDSDDFVETDLLDTLYNSLKGKDCDIICFGYSVLQEGKYTRYLLKNKSLSFANYEDIKRDVICAVYLAENKFKNIPFNTTWGKAFKRSFVIDNNLSFDETLRRSQDVVYNLYAFDKASKIDYIDKALYNYRMDNESLSRSYNKETAKRMTLTANAALKFAELHKDTPIYTEAAMSFCRRCFKIIVNLDFLNKANTESFTVKKERFKEILKTEPFATAFSGDYLKNSRFSGDLQMKLIAGGNLGALKLYLFARKILRNLRNAIKG